MNPTVNDILAALEAIAPARLAEDWDNVGLQIGSRQWPATHVLTALDPTPNVIREVRRRKGDVLVTHHPLIFSPIRTLDLDTPQGVVLQELIANQIAVITAHTNLDSVQGGVNDVLAALLTLEEVTVLQPADPTDLSGLGRLGNLEMPITLGDLATMLKTRLGLTAVRYAGNPELTARRVALCSGSGSSMIEAFIKSGADVFITGDVRYHDAREIEFHGRGVIDIGHFESEHIVLESLATQLTDRLAAQGLKVTVSACQDETAPFRTV